MVAQGDEHLPGRHAEDRKEFVVWWYRLTLVGTFTFFAVLLLTLLPAARSNPAAVAYLGLASAAMIGVVIRALGSASIKMTDTEVIIRGMVRTRRLNWSGVRSVGVERGSSAAFLPWRVPYFEMKDGSVVLADDVRSLRADSLVDTVVAEARRRIRDES